MPQIIFLGTCSGTEPMPHMMHSAIVVEKNNNYYWFDAGEGCSRSACLRGMDLLHVRAVFATHPHMDHVGGLANLMWNIRKFTTISDRRPVNKLIQVFMPSMKSWDGIMGILKESEQKFVCDYEIEANPVEDGLVFSNEDISVRAYHNHHIPGDGEDGIWHSFSYLIETDGKKIVYSGDIRDVYDLEGIIGNGCDFLLVETGHHKVADICAYAKTKNIGALYFTHHGREIINHRESAQVIVDESGLNAFICTDGMTVDI